MVFYFTSTVVSPPYKLFMGADKYESKNPADKSTKSQLISLDKSNWMALLLIFKTQTSTWSNGDFQKTFGFTLTNYHRPMFISVCKRYVNTFDVANQTVSNYPLFDLQGQTIDDIPSAVIEDAAQLVKANSIAGNKMNNIDVVYTMWDNLKKTAAMEVGQVSFHRDKGESRVSWENSRTTQSKLIDFNFEFRCS